MNYTNYHTHTYFCDGSDEPEKYVISAINKKMSALGFSAHVPLHFENTWSLKQDRAGEYFEVINGLIKKYKGQIEIFSSLEMDFIPGLTKDFQELKEQYKLDYTLGSIHLVADLREPLQKENPKQLWFIDGPDHNYIEGLKLIFKNDIKKAVTTYYEQLRQMIVTQSPDIIGHLDKIKMNNKNRFFGTEENWYKNLAYETLKIIKQHSLLARVSNACPIVEVNTRGIYKKRSEELFPSAELLEQCLNLDIPITINSDSHSPEELINYYPETINILKDIGFKTLSVFHNKNWIQKPFD